MANNNESVEEIKNDGLSFNPELEDKSDGLSYNPELENTKIIASDPVVDEPDNDDGLTFNKELQGPTFIQDKSYNIDVSQYEGDVGNGTEVYMPDVTGGGIDILNQNRADNQGFFSQAGNFLGQAVVGEIIGGTIEGMGYLLDVGSIIDVMQGDEAEWGNFITEAGQGIRKGTEEAMRIHQDPSAEGFGKMADSGWWFSNGVSVASTLSMLIPTMGAMRALSFVGKGIGMSKGLRSVRKAMGMAEQMGTKASWATNGISQAVLSRNIENWMEAHGTFEDYKLSRAGKINPQTNEKFTDEELTKLASQAASSNWKKGWAMLAQDIPQYLALGKVFNPISKKMVNATNAASKKGITANWKPWQQKSLGVAKTFFGEGGEESYQYLISEQSKLKADLDIGYINQKQYDQKMSDAFGSEEMLTSAFFGGLGGNVFKAAGAGVNDVFKSKDRKEYEKNLAESYNSHIGNKSKQVSLMFQYLNQSDEKGSKVLRDQVINDSMMTLATEALEMDKFDQFYETIGLVSEMSEEDLKNFENQTGQEFSSELAKQYAPELQKKAIEIRDIYIKHRNYYAPTTSSRLARLEMENKGLETRAEKGKEAAENIKAVVRKNFKTKASETLHTKLALREKGQVLRRRKTALTARLNAEGKDSPKRAFIQEALDDNARSFKKYQLDTRNQTKANKALEGDDKEARDLQAEDDAASEKTYNKLYKEEVLSALESEAVAEENIIINNEDMAFSKSEEGISLVKKENLQKKINEYDDIEDTSVAIEKLKEVKDDLADKIDYLSDEEKTSLKESVGAKIKELEQKQKEDESTAKAELVEAARLAKLREQNSDPSVVSNQKITEIADVVEDENSDADPVLSEDQLRDSEKRDKQLVGSGQFMAMLDKVNNKDGTSATPGYDEYVVNPSNKVGQEFRYTPVSMDQKLTKTQNDAISDFEKLKPGDDIPQNVLDYLPIQSTHTEYKDVFTFLNTKPNQNAPLEDRVGYEQGYAAQREIIINKLVNGEDVTSTVALNTGGDLIMDYDAEERLVPEHSVLDLMQINGDESKVNLMVTNKEGFLMDTQKKTDKDLGNRSMLLDRDSADNRMPYRGGMFLKVKKANGEPFALRLNLKKNTRKQAELLAELLIKTGVPVATRDKEGKVITNKKGVQVVEKEIKLSTPLEYLDEDLQNDIREQMGPEIDMLDPKYKNPTVNDLINSFIYVSEQTKGKTSELYFSSDNHLMFGNGKSIKVKNRAEASSQEELVDFLVNNKRRQFKLSMWNENGAYRKYVLDNKIISTDGTINGPLFQNTRKRTKRGDMTGKRIQLYMDPVTNEAPVQMDESGQVSTMFSLANIPGAKPVKKPAPSSLKPNGGLSSNNSQFEYYESTTMEVTVNRKTKDDKPSVNKDSSDVFKVVMSRVNSAGNMEISKPMTQSFSTFEEASVYAEKFISKDKDNISKAKQGGRRQFQNKVYVKAYDNLRNKSESELKSILKARNKSAKSGAQSSPISVAESFIARQILDGKTKELDADYAKTEESNDTTQQTSDSLTKDVVFDSANGEQVAWDESSKTWVKKVDENMAISEEATFKKDGFTYSYMDYMPADQQYQKQDLSTGSIVTKNITKKEYEDAKGDLDDNPFRVEKISFKEAKRLYEYSKLAQQTSEVELKYSPVDMKGYGKSYKQEDISEGGKSIIFNPYKQGVKINEGVLTASIDDVDGKTFYPISVNLSNTPEYLDYKNKKDILDAERKRLIEAGEKGIEDMLRGEGASMSTAKKQLLDLLGKELGKKNSITSFKGGNISKPTDIENTYKIGDTQISANENNDVSSPPKGSPVSQSFLQFPSDEEMDDVDNFDDVDFEDVNMGFDPSEDLSKQDDGKPETKCKK